MQNTGPNVSTLDAVPMTVDNRTSEHRGSRFRKFCICRQFSVTTGSILVAVLAALCVRLRGNISDILPQHQSVSVGQIRQSTRTSLNRSPATSHRGIAVTIYSYDRPSDLSRLLEDIERMSSTATLPVSVHVLDDNAFGCVPDSPISSNFLDDFDPRNAVLPISQLVPTMTIPHHRQEMFVSCTARRRYRAAESIVARNVHRGWKLFSAHYRHGRRRYWHLVHMAHALLRRHAEELNAGYYIFLPDDVRLASDFFNHAVAAWNNVADVSKMTMMLHIEESRLHSAVWTDFLPERISDTLHRIGWVESGNFMTDKSLLNFFNWSFPPIPIQRWKDNPPISSGVGALLSESMHAAGFSMYRTDRSLVAHVGVRLSKMNSAFRAHGVDAHLTLNFADGEGRYKALLHEAATVTASIASLWNREISLHSTVDSLAHQVDHINVYLNGYDTVPAFLRVPHVTALLSSDSGRGDMGDIGKFYWANNVRTDFHITADDDMIYPDDYVTRLCQFLTVSLRTPAVVGLHGIRILHHDLLSQSNRRGKGYYGSREVFMGTGSVSNMEGVHILGTGTLMYRVADFGKIDLDAVFRIPNMADLWLGILGQKLSIPFVVMPHAEGWLKEFPGTSQESLYRRFTRRRNADRHQTAAAIAAAPWVIYPVKLADEGNTHDAG
jgi:hypothetical protein